MHDRAYSGGATDWVLIKVNNVVFMGHQFMRTGDTLTGPARKIGITEAIDLGVNQEPQIKRFKSNAEKGLSLATQACIASRSAWYSGRRMICQ
jgi:hypothetical protein